MMQARSRTKKFVHPISGMAICGLVLLVSSLFCFVSLALETPASNFPVNDAAGIIPHASYNELKQTLTRLKSRTGYNVAVLTLPSLEDRDLDDVGSDAFARLPLAQDELQRSILLVVARKEHQAGIQVGAELRTLFPEPAASQKLRAQVELYINGLRPDLGIHGAVGVISRVIKGEIRFDRVTEEDRLEDASLQGRGAGAIFAVLLAPYLALVIGLLWGLYATHYQVHTETRLFIGAVLGGGTAKIAASLMSAMGGYSDGLWYFILTVSVLLGTAGSLTEYWMAGEWSGIPRVKDRNLTRKPTDKMGI
jgi:uncharacterized membrane protein YgcG